MIPSLYRGKIEVLLKVVTKYHWTLKLMPIMMFWSTPRERKKTLYDSDIRIYSATRALMVLALFSSFALLPNHFIFSGTVICLESTFSRTPLSVFSVVVVVVDTAALTEVVVVMGTVETTVVVVVVRFTDVVVRFTDVVVVSRRVSLF